MKKIYFSNLNGKTGNFVKQLRQNIFLNFKTDEWTANKFKRVNGYKIVD